MKGKKIKVAEYNLTFGTVDRYVNILGFFKYKKNGNLYLVFSDFGADYELVYYGTGHLKNNNLLCMNCNVSDSEIIKEYIYKIFNNEELLDFEVYDLDDVLGLELISSNKLEVKLEIIKDIENKLILGDTNNEVNTNDDKTLVKKKKNSKFLLKFLIVILVFMLMGGGYFYLSSIINSDAIIRSVSCSKEYELKELNATVNELNIYSFMKNNELKKIDSTINYKFLDQISYENFISNGNVFNYMPKDSKKYTPNNNNFTIEYLSETIVDTSYNEPSEYEEVISYYTGEGYVCNERIE